MKKTIVSLCCAASLVACGSSPDSHREPPSGQVVSAVTPVPSDSDPGLKALKQIDAMNDLLENVIMPAYGLDAKTQTCIEPPAACACHQK